MKRHHQLSKSIRDNRFAIIVFIVSFSIFISVIGSLAYVLTKGKFKAYHGSALTGDIAWPVFDGGLDSPGTNYKESTLNAGNVSGLVKLWKSPTPAAADSAIVEWPNVTTAGGVKDLVFVNTVKGNLLAFDAATGAKVWEADPSSTNYNGQGTKSTPAIDPSGSFIYAYALDGYVHKYNISTGVELKDTGFPVQATILPNDIEKGSSSLNIGNGYLYMTIGGNDGDYNHYTGHIVAVKLATGTATVWNAECSDITRLLGTSGSNYCSNNQAGIWNRPGVKVDPVTGNVFVATGNGNYNANNGGHNWGDSIVELKPDLSQVVDSYTPSSYASLDSKDADLGSSAPVILPTQSASSKPYLLVQGGKDHLLRLFDRTNLSGQGGPGHTDGELSSVPVSNEMHGQPALWVDGSGTSWIFCVDDGGNLYAFKLVITNGTPKLVQVYKNSTLGVSSSPFVANGVLYLDAGSILAVNPTTGAVLFDSKSIGITITPHWESPVVVNGTLFTSDNASSVYALSNPSAIPPAPTPVPPAKLGDINGDGLVDITDLSILLSHYGKTVVVNTLGDLNGDGRVDITDLSILLSHYKT